MNFSILKKKTNFSLILKKFKIVKKMFTSISNVFFWKPNFSFFLQNFNNKKILSGFLYTFFKILKKKNREGGQKSIPFFFSMQTFFFCERGYVFSCFTQKISKIEETFFPNLRYIIHTHTHTHHYNIFWNQRLENFEFDIILFPTLLRESLTLDSPTGNNIFWNLS